MFHVIWRCGTQAGFAEDGQGRVQILNACLSTCVCHPTCIFHGCPVLLAALQQQ